MKRYRILFYFLTIFITVNFLTRVILLFTSMSSVQTDPLSLTKIFLVGLFYDLLTFFYYIIPFVIYLFLVPTKIFNSKIHKYISLIIFFMVVYGVIFNSFSEWFFWEEFGKRFNFIAVDYLVYTHEVIKNIQESYPLPILLIVIALLSGLVFDLLCKKTECFKEVFKDSSSYKDRVLPTFLLLLLPFFSFNLLDKQTLATKLSQNRYNQELAKNGFYSLFSAFRHNELDYYEFYKTISDEKMLKRYKELTKEKDAKFIDINTKEIKKASKEHRYNIILVMMESMSAKFLGAYGDKKNLTPNLDKLAQNSLFFNNLFATGTRTVRGMEAVMISVPPTPGRSIVKRPDNQNIFSLGWIFKQKGYENKFIYAGHGYFDNMNAFFEGNGFKIVDRLFFSDDEVSFSNVWGVCDEDLYNKTLKEADISYKNKQPFFSFVMTTSNHRPYTYPQGKIDIPSHTGRDGAVKYSDFAIGEFLKKAQKKPWFKNTIFVFVADHNAASAGKNELPLYRYKIPCMIYAPNIIKPKTVSKLSSQIDIAPTLLSILNFSYKSKFYGKDIQSDDYTPRALIGNYQKLGLYRDNKLTVLYPNKTVKEFQVEKLDLYSNTYKQIPTNQSDELDAITYYQSASYFYKNKLNKFKP